MRALRERLAFWIAPWLKPHTITVHPWDDMTVTIADCPTTGTDGINLRWRTTA